MRLVSCVGATASVAGAAGLPSEQELSELEQVMRTGGADVTALQYVRTLKRNNLTGSGKGGAEAMGHHSGGTMPSQNNLLDWADKTFGSGLSQVAKGVKTLLSGAGKGATQWGHAFCALTRCRVLYRVPILMEILLVWARVACGHGGRPLRRCFAVGHFQPVHQQDYPIVS